MPDDDPELLELEGVLREAAAELDPVPEHLPEYARAIFDWRAVDAELAELTFDSSSTPDRPPAGEAERSPRSSGRSLAEQPALMRGPEPSRLLTFQTDALTIEIEVTGTELIGQLVPSQPAEVELQHRGGRLPVPADPLGRFTVTAPPHGPVRLSCRSTGHRQVVTDWFSL